MSNTRTELQATYSAIDYYFMASEGTASARTSQGIGQIKPTDSDIPPVLPEKDGFSLMPLKDSSLAGSSNLLVKSKFSEGGAAESQVAINAKMANEETSYKMPLIRPRKSSLK